MNNNNGTFGFWEHRMIWRNEETQRGAVSESSQMLTPPEVFNEVKTQLKTLGTTCSPENVCTDEYPHLVAYATYAPNLAETSDERINDLLGLRNGSFVVDTNQSSMHELIIREANPISGNAAILSISRNPHIPVDSNGNLPFITITSKTENPYVSLPSNSLDPNTSYDHYGPVSDSKETPNSLDPKNTSYYYYGTVPDPNEPSNSLDPKNTSYDLPDSQEIIKKRAKRVLNKKVEQNQAVNQADKPIIPENKQKQAVNAVNQAKKPNNNNNIGDGATARGV